MGHLPVPCADTLALNLPVGTTYGCLTRLSAFTRTFGGEVSNVMGAWRLATPDASLVLSLPTATAAVCLAA